MLFEPPVEIHVSSARVFSRTVARREQFVRAADSSTDVLVNAGLGKLVWSSHAATSNPLASSWYLIVDPVQFLD